MIIMAVKAVVEPITAAEAKAAEVAATIMAGKARTAKSAGRLLITNKIVWKLGNLPDDLFIRGQRVFMKKRLVPLTLFFLFFFGK
jgi:hypothetical protein